MQLSSEQRRNIRRALDVAKKMGASHKEMKALIEAGFVESNWKNINYGDRDSLGVLQQRPSQGWGTPDQILNVEHAVKSFLSRARRAKGGTSGQLAQAVQRSAFPERYDQRGKDAASVLRQFGTGGSVGQTSRVVTTPGVDNSEERKSLLLNYVQQGSNDPNGLLNLASGLKEAQDIPGKTRVVTATTSSAGGLSGKKLTKKDLLTLGKTAQRMGLKVSENPYFDKQIDPVHAPNSLHYSDRAMDVSGSPEAMAKYARVLARRYGSQLTELFWNGQHSRNIKNGKRQAKNFVSGHTNHVHVGI